MSLEGGQEGGLAVTNRIIEFRAERNLSAYSLFQTKLCEFYIVSVRKSQKVVCLFSLLYANK